MNKISYDKIVIFGAGKIGRSFIGQLFSRGDYEVVFIDVYKPVIDELNRRKKYNVIIKSDHDEVINVSNVRGVYAEDVSKVSFEVASSSLVAVSVGSIGLNAFFPLLAKGLLERYAFDQNAALDIIIAENMRNSNIFFRNNLTKLLPPEYPFEQLIGLIETSIGKMVPIMQKKDMEEDILQVFSESYNTLIIDKKAFKNPIPNIKGLSPKENIKAWVDRKLFIHNLGHASTAYVGHIYNPDAKYIYEVLEISNVYDIVKGAMLQSANVLVKKYPDEYTINELDDHIEDLLNRFTNRALGDTIYRVGSDLTRKLGVDDRFSGIIKLALSYGCPYDKILYGLVCGCHFMAKDENGTRLKKDIVFLNRYNADLDLILSEISGFDKISDSALFIEAKKMNPIQHGAPNI